MKTKDIKPGVVYGYRRGKTGRVEPVVFLAKPEPGRLYSVDQYAKPPSPHFKHRPEYNKPRREAWRPDIGYPVVFGDDDTDLAELAKVTLEEFKTVTVGYDEDRHINYGIVTVPAHVIGPYADVVAEEHARETARRKEWAEERERKAAALERAETLAEVLHAHGIAALPENWNEPDALVIPLDDVEKLIGLLDTHTEETGSL